MAMMQMVVSGVSSRKVEDVTYELCGRKFSKSMVSKLCERLDPIVKNFQNRPLEKHYPFLVVDAIYLKVREDDKVRSKGLLVAIAINQDGQREIIGFRVANTESETSWSEFFSSLKDRGLHNVHLITSDSHRGLVNAIRKHFQGATWQRCQNHFSRNMLDMTPKSLQPELKENLRKLYEAVDLESATKVRNEIMDKYNTKAPRAMNLLDEAFADVTAVLSVPFKYRKRLRTSNGIERLNEEIRRRERAIRIFPNEDSVIRLIGALLMEQDEKWQTGRKYFEMDLYYQTLANSAEEPSTTAVD